MPESALKRRTSLLSPATASGRQGDSLSLTNVVMGKQVSPTFVDCSGYTNKVSGGDTVPFCAQVIFTDAKTGDRTTTNNSLYSSMYDACGELVNSQTTYGWHVDGSNPPYLASGGQVGNSVTLPMFGVCFGTWTVFFTFSQTFTDGTTLNATGSVQITTWLDPAKVAALYQQLELDGGPILAAEQYGGCACGYSTHAQATGNPIDTASGNFWHTFDDLATPGRGPSFDLTRTYNSLAAGTDGAFGYGWTDSYAISLTLGDTTAVVNQADGAQATFTLNGTAWSAPPRVLATLTHNGDGSWTFTRQARHVLDFDATGRLTAIKDLNGYITTVSYPSGSQMVVTDPAGRMFTFSSTGTHVTSVSDSSTPARTVQYSYDQAGNLTDVIDVGGGHWQFTYDDQHRLLTMRSPRYYGDTTTTPAPVITNHYDAAGRVDWQSDQLGRKTSFDYASIPNSTKVTDPQGNITVDEYTYGLLTAKTSGYGTNDAATWYYRYDPATTGQTVIVDPNAHVTTSDYDPDGNLLSSTDALDRTTSYTYNALDETTSITDPKQVNGHPITTTMSYDTTGNLLTKSAPLLDASGTTIASATTTYHYDDATYPGDVTSITDANNLTTDYGYDAEGDLFSVTDPAGDQTTYGYDADRGWRTSMVSPKGNVDGADPAAYTTTYAYDGYGRPTITRDPLWTSADPHRHETVRHYDADGNLDSITDGNNHTTGYDYDPAGQQTAVHRPNGTTLRNDYWPDGTVEAQYDGAGNATSYLYNHRGQLVDIITPGIGLSAVLYDAVGNLSNVVDHSGRITTNTYDDANQLTSISYSDGVTPNVTNIGYDADGQRISMTDGTGTSNWSWDSLHRMTSATNGAGKTIGYHYDLGDRLTGIDYPGSTGSVARGYDAANRLHTVTDWNGKTTTFNYDHNSNPQTEVYPNGTTATSSHDAADRLVGISDAPTGDPNSPLASFSYGRDGTDQLSSVTSTGVPADTHSYSYDQVNRLISVDQSSYGYDTADNLTQLVDGTQQFYNTAHELTASSSSPAISLVGTTSGGNSTTTSLTLTLPAGTTANDTVLLATTLDNSKNVATPSGYSVVGTYASGTGNSAAKVVVYRHTVAAGDTSATLSYGSKFAKSAVLAVYRSLHPATPIDIAAAGSIASGTEVTAPSITTTGTNDRLVMITGADGSAGAWTFPSDLTRRVAITGGATDAALADGNLTTPGATGTRWADHTTSTQLVGVLVALKPAQTSYGYDSTGNRTSIAGLNGATTTLNYDQANRITGYGTNATYTYNGDGLRMSKAVSGTSTGYAWDEAEGTPLILTAGTTSYIYGPGGTPLEQINSNGTVYFHQDQLGSTRLLTNGSGSVVASYTYDPYGKLAAQTGSADTALRWAGQDQDTESGLYYLRARYYDPATGQFTSLDPLANLTRAAYTYGNDSPVNETDPRGLCSINPFSSSFCITEGLDKIGDGLDAAQHWTENHIVQPVESHIGDIATGGAIITCIASGLTACAVAQGIAYIARVYQRSEQYGFSNSLPQDIEDLLVTSVSFSYAGLARLGPELAPATSMVLRLYRALPGAFGLAFGAYGECQS